MMNIIKKRSDKDRSIKQLRVHLQHLTEELDKTTANLQLMEIGDAPNVSRINPEIEEEISRLVRKQNLLSHEIIEIRKRIQRLSARTILKAELLILPVLFVLISYVAINSWIYFGEPAASLKTWYTTENLRGGPADSFAYWDINDGAPLVVNIEDNAHVDKVKLDAVKNAILSTDMIIDESSFLDHIGPINKSEYFKGWQGALRDIPGLKHTIPDSFQVVESPNSVGDVIITLYPTGESNDYSGFTKTITDGKHILKTFIAIYNSDKLSGEQIETITRQQFGHALGLPYTSNQADLMHGPILINSYISKCDINTLKKLYDETSISDDFCAS